MGAYLNQGNRAFQMALGSDIYVDKTGMIQYLNSVVNTKQRFVSVSRPRRFGKMILMAGGQVHVDVTGYQNDMSTFHSKDDILTMFIHLGYLGYDRDTQKVFIPNKEVLQVFKTSTKTVEWTATFRALNNSRKLLEATWAGDQEKVAELIET